MRSGELDTRPPPPPPPPPLRKIWKMFGNVRPVPLIFRRRTTMMLSVRVFAADPGSANAVGKTSVPPRPRKFRPRRPPMICVLAAGAGSLSGENVIATTLIELLANVILKELVFRALGERHFLQQDETLPASQLPRVRSPQILIHRKASEQPRIIASPDETFCCLGTPPRPNPGERAGGPGRNRIPGTIYSKNGFQSLSSVRRALLVTLARDLSRRRRAITPAESCDQFLNKVLCLARGLITLVVSSQRARTLGRQQGKSRAGVSHETSRPPAVIDPPRTT